VAELIINLYCCLELLIEPNAFESKLSFEEAISSISYMFQAF